MSSATSVVVAVRFDSALGDVLRGDVVPVLASLPDDFVVGADAASGEVVVVDGRRGDWPASVQEALATARGVLLSEPRHPAPAGGRSADEVVRGLAHLAESAGVPVVVDRRWSGAPGVRAFAASFSEAVSTATSIALLLVEDDESRTAHDAALDALGLARAAGAATGRLDRFQRRAASWSAWGASAGGAVLHLQGVHTAAGAGAVLTASSATTEASVRVPDARTAAPALARCADSWGERTLPTEFEPAARSAWRRLHERLLGAGPGEGRAGAELAALADDLALLRAAV